MVNLIGMLSHLKPFKVLVAGDFMLDRYTHGKVGRISPEAPVPVLHVQREHSLPGGAGNVALNLASLGAQVFALGRIGDDLEGEHLKRLLFDQDINAQGLLTENNYHTPVKNRLMGGSQQMLRIDFEHTHPIADDLVRNVALPDCDLIAISDYNKGFLTPTVLAALIKHGKELGIPIIVDPKGEDFSKYKGATLIKPNLKEAYAASKLPLDSSLNDVAKALFNQSEAQQILITRSSEGLSLFSDDNTHTHFPVRCREVQDVTGAGDTVLAMLCMALANDLELASAAHLSNVAA
ncbi:MAG TPA: bifunctional ADP-heptose synthase, partial [Chlamydiales bacterium]|nr:bifunctional ADP-heptose synthase [Chlamydiales bacterium]